MIINYYIDNFNYCFRLMETFDTCNKEEIRKQLI